MEQPPNKNQENGIEKPKIKYGVDFIFEQKPELAEIGNKEQYSEYLDTIFPDSKIKDILYHGSRSEFEEFNLERSGLSGRNYGKGVYTTPDKSWAQKYAQEKHLLLMILNIKNPFITDQRYEDYYGVGQGIPDNEKFTKYINNDAILNYDGLDRELLKKVNQYFIEYVGEKDKNGFPISYTEGEIYQFMPRLKEVVVPNTEQVHILGSKKDTENYKKFIEKKY